MAKFTRPVVLPDDQVIVAIYLRASDPRKERAATKDRPGADARQANSLPVQRAACERYAAERGWRVADIWQDGESGFNEGRPGYMAMLADRSWNTVLVWKVDRLGRDQAESLTVVKQLRKAGKRLVGATQDLDDPMSVSMFTMFAEMESRIKSERVTPVMLKLASEGRYVSRAPFPYRLVDKQLVVEPVAAALYTEAAGAVLAGGSVRSLVKGWNGRGVTSPTGGQWCASSLLKILRCPTHAGLITWPGLDEPVVGTHEAVISLDDWRALQRRLTVAGQSWSRVTTRAPQFLLAGFGRCACGASLCHHRSGPNSYLACRGRRHGQACAINGMLRMDSAEAAVRWVLAPVLNRTTGELLDHYGSATAVEYDAAADAVERSRARIEAERDRAARQLDGLVDMLAAGDIDRAAYHAKRAQYAAAREQAEAALAAMPAPATLPTADPAATARLLESLGALYTGTDLASRRELLDVLGVTVTREAEGLWVRVAPAWRPWTRGDCYFPLGGRGRKDGAPGRLLVPSGDDGNPYASERTIAPAAA